MREIKFRVWDKIENQMVDAKIFDFNIGSIGCSTYLKKDGSQKNGDIIQNYEIMQYTGLKDKNGKDIYEGDIVIPAENYLDDYLDDDYRKRPFIIEYIMLNNCGDCYFDSGIGFNLYLHEPEDLKIIGNIYENPELLNE